LLQEKVFFTPIHSVVHEIGQLINAVIKQLTKKYVTVIFIEYNSLYSV